MNRTSTRAGSSKRRRWVVVAVVLVVAGGAAAYFYATRAAVPTATAQAGPRTVPIVLAPHDVTVAGPGTLEASTSLNLTVAANLSGRIATIAAVGDRVEAGDAVASLDPSAFERALKTAEFDLERAQAQLRSLESSQAQAQATGVQQKTAAEAAVATTRRDADAKAADLELVQRLHGLGAESDESLRAARSAAADSEQAATDAQADLSALVNTQALQASARQDDLTNTRLSVSQAELKVEEAQADLSSLTVTAPFAGIISQVNVVVGAGVSDSTSLMTLIDDSTVSLVVQIDETQVGTVQRGQPATVTLDALPGRTFSGSVTAVSPVARLESNIAIFDVVVSLPNADLTLRPGMTAEAEIAVRHVEQALTLPSGAVTQGQGGAAIMVVTKDGQTVRRPVEIVETVGFQTVVTGDLADAASVLEPGGGEGGGALTTGRTNGARSTQFGVPGVGGGGFGGGGFGGGPR